MDMSFLNYSLLGNTVKAYLLFIGIILLCILFRRLFSRLFSHLLLQLFGRFGKEVNTTVFIGMLVKPVEFLISLLLVYCAINQLSYPLGQVLFKHNLSIDGKLVPDDTTLLQANNKIFLLLTLISFFWIMLRMIDFIAYVLVHRATEAGEKEHGTMVQFVKELVKITAILVGFFVVLGWVFQVNVVQLIAGLGIGGIAIALAAKESLENLLGYFTIFVDKPFIVGDFVKVTGVEGTVERIGFRSTRLRTADKNLVTIPNKKMIDTPLENLSMRDYRRVKFEFGLSATTPGVVVKAITDEITNLINKREDTNGNAVVVFENFSNGAINVLVTYFVLMNDFDDFQRVKQEVNLGIVEVVTKCEAGLAIPTALVIGKPDGSAAKP